MPAEQNIKIFSGTSSRKLAETICDMMDVPLGAARSVRFSDGELFVEIEENVRGADEDDAAIAEHRLERAKVAPGRVHVKVHEYIECVPAKAACRWKGA